MPMVDLIEIVPPDAPVQARVTVPGSKSITNRALILAALVQGTTVLRGALWSEDTQAMVECLRRLGFEICVEQDAREFCNRSITVVGRGGLIPNAGSAGKPLELFVGNAGTAARFLAAFVCLGKGVYRLDGIPRMRERPQSALFQALRELGYTVESPNDKLPAVICGAGPRAASCDVSIEESSQFASALLLSGGVGGWQIRVRGEDDEEMPYVRMTERLAASFPAAGGVFRIEADASSASYFCAADWLLRSSRMGHVVVDDFPQSNWQIDAAFPDFLPLPAEVSRQSDLGDSIMTAITLAPFAQTPTRFTHLERLRLQECERVAALRTELAKCGARVIEDGQTLTLHPGPLHGAVIHTYNDHRMAMCFAILGLKVPGLRIENPACVKKTFPNFFQKLGAEPSQGGFGLAILDATTGRRLSVEDLFAD
jgi:3-phosphoshikimate 1-carboxyvinyltransferase